MTVALVTPEYVADTTGADVTSNPERVDFLIIEASSLVMEYLERSFTPENAPTAVRQAVAILVHGALESGSGQSSGVDVKAEQIGDYRVEFAGAGQFTPGLDIRRVEHLLKRYRATARAIRANVALDGAAPGGLGLVVNQ